MEAARRPDDDAPRRPVWRGVVGYLAGLGGLLTTVVLVAAVILILVEELWVLAVGLVAAAALVYAVMAWLNGDWDS